MKLTRRNLLSSAAALALSGPAAAQPIPGADEIPFQGNPNVAITAIDTSGGIACSRTSGQVPFFVQVSASAIAAAGTETPYEDLEYIWDFGDAAGQEIFGHPVDGRPVNANAQQGPEGAYCYRTPGAYTITLKIRGKDGGAYRTATITQVVTATAFKAREYWFDSVAGNDANNGTGPATPKKSIDALNRLMANDCAFHLKAGSVWMGKTGIRVIVGNGSRVRIDAYGDGPAPVIAINSGNGCPLVFSNGGLSAPSPKDDIVISGIAFKITGQAASPEFGAIVHVNTNLNRQAPISNFYLDRCTMTTDLFLGITGVVFQYTASNPNLSRCGIWGGSIISPTAENRTPGNAMGFFCGAREWMFLVGVEISGSGSSNIFTHHIYSDVQNHSLFRWINFGSGIGRNFCIKLAYYQRGATLEFANYHLISECRMSGALRGHSADDGSFDYNKVQFQNVVSQRNAYANLAGDGVVYFGNGKSMTERDNLVFGCNGGRWWTPAPGHLLRAKVYRNRIFRTGGGIVIDYFNQLVPWSQPQVITDNIIYSTEAAPKFLQVKIHDQVAAKSFIDRNQYWAPNAPGGANARLFYDGDAAKTLAEWRAAGFDANGRIANPGWPDPAHGQFAN